MSILDAEIKVNRRLINEHKALIASRNKKEKMSGPKHCSNCFCSAPNTFENIKNDLKRIKNAVLCFQDINPKLHAKMVIKKYKKEIAKTIVEETKKILDSLK